MNFTWFQLQGCLVQTAAKQQSAEKEGSPNIHRGHYNTVEPLYKGQVGEPLYKGQVGDRSFVPYAVKPLHKGQVRERREVCSGEEGGMFRRGGRYVQERREVCSGEEG